MEALRSGGGVQLFNNGCSGTADPTAKKKGPGKCQERHRFLT